MLNWTFPLFAQNDLEVDYFSLVRYALNGKIVKVQNWIFVCYLNT